MMSTNSFESAEVTRSLKFHLRSRDQILLLHIPRTNSPEVYTHLTKQFPMEKVWPITHDRLHYLRETSPNELVKYRLFISEDDYDVYHLFRRKPVFITMLRDPVERVISHYTSIMNDPSHILHKEIIEKDLNLLEFVHQPEMEDLNRDRQVRQLAGAITGEARGLPDHVLIEIAKARLDEFAFFGLSERFQESVNLLHHTFSWEDRSEESLSMTSVSTQRADYPPDEIAAIEQFNKLDKELFHYAEEVFENRGVNSLFNYH